MNQTSKVKFLDRIRHALGRESDSNVEAINQEFFMNPEPVYRDALSDSNENAKALIDEFLSLRFFRSTKLLRTKLILSCIHLSIYPLSFCF